jgi:alpha-L-fucosidase 2
MKFTRAMLIILLAVSSMVWADAWDQWTLQYSQPAAQWTDALPLGNGHMGAMVFGDPQQERIQFNEDTVWAGAPMDYINPQASAEVLAEVRRLLFAGQQKEASQLARKLLSDPIRQMPYQPFGDLYLEMPGHAQVTDYRRCLDLDGAISTVTYEQGQVLYERETFVSYPDRVMLVRLTANRVGQIAFRARLACAHKNAQIKRLDARTLEMRGQVQDHDYKRIGKLIPGKIRLAAQLQVRAESGEVQVSDEGIEVSGADTVTLLLTLGTSFKRYDDISADPVARCKGMMKAIEGRDYATLRSAHIKDHRSLFRRCTLDLGTTSAIHLDTDDRVLRNKEVTDPQLMALLFQYGRYLMIASSRPGSQPANLQGIWNESLSPPWESKYTTNINAEMNYWPAEPTNLSECHEPFLKMVEEVAQTGRKLAKSHYGLPGWVLHHNTDGWRGAAAINSIPYGFWPTGGAWVCQHLWWHYAYTEDIQFLRERAYPLMKEACRFYEAWLIEDPRQPDKWLISGPSNSPENGGFVMGPTMDHQIIRHLLRTTAEAARILGVDEGLQTQWRSIHERIAPNQIGQYGQLQEWLEDRDNPKNKHRHVSHLWGLHPGDEISIQTPDLLAAARKTLTMRGDGGTSWSMAWKINFWARLLEGDRAVQLISNFLTLTGSSKTSLTGGGVYANLFSAHPPFQIDGNFGATAGITEMLLQNHIGEIHLLPALPRAWPNGSVSGLKARGDVTVSIRWRAGKLAAAHLTGSRARSVSVRYQGQIKHIDLVTGQAVKVRFP